MERKGEYIEEGVERGAIARIIELNVGQLEYALRQINKWEPGPDGVGQIATAKYYVTDTGHICAPNDPHAFIKCVSNFLRVGDTVTHESTDMYGIEESTRAIPDALHTILIQSADLAAKQVEEFPKFIPRAW